MSLFTETLHLSSQSNKGSPLAASHHPLDIILTRPTSTLMADQRGKYLCTDLVILSMVLSETSTLGVLCNTPFIIRYEFD